MRAAPVSHGTASPPDLLSRSNLRNSEGRDISRGPGAPLPSTLVYTAGFVTGWWIHGALPFRIAADGASPFQVAMGALIVTFGLVMFGWGMQTFARERTGIMPQKPASHVVMSGPYRWTRNPMYVGFTAIYGGLAVVLNQVWPLVILPIVLVVLFLAVIHREERYMRATFGDAYDEYCRRVPRWL